MQAHIGWEESSRGGSWVAAKSCMTDVLNEKLGLLYIRLQGLPIFFFNFIILYLAVLGHDSEAFQSDAGT